MSAIAGIWRLDGQSSIYSCKRVMSALTLFGKDHQHQIDLEPISIGRCLTQTVPEDRYDTQPLIGGGGRFHLVADARIDDRQTLARQLGIPPSELANLSDPDLILRAYERWQQACCDHLVGDYAFAVWDHQEKRLHLFRDQLGKRPLFFYRSTNLIAFASMPQGLHALPEIPRAPDKQRFLDAFQDLQHSGDRSFHKDIRKVKAGHYATLTEHSVQQYRHWNPQYNPDLSLTFQDHVERVRTLLDQAVADQIRGETKVATTLSAGMDSSAVTVSAALHLKNRGQVSAYTSVPRDGYHGSGSQRLFNEGPNAAATAQLYANIDHHLVHGTSTSLLDSLYEATHYDAQPINNLCNTVWLNSLSREIAQDGHKFALMGTLGNMTFSYGNDYYLTDKIKRFRPFSLFKSLLDIRRVRGNKTAAGNAFYSLYRLLPTSILAPLEEHQSDVTYLHGDRRRETLRWLRYFKADDWSRRLMFFDTIDYYSVHKAKLAQFGLDVRDPTADIRLVEACLNIPAHFFSHEGHSRAIGRAVLKGRVPDAVINTREKGYQGADWHEQFVKDRDMLSEQLAIIDEFETLNEMIPTDRLKTWMDDLPDQNWNKKENVAKYRISILRAVSYGDYFRRLSGSNR